MIGGTTPVRNQPSLVTEVAVRKVVPWPAKPRRSRARPLMKLKMS